MIFDMAYYRYFQGLILDKCYIRTYNIDVKLCGIKFYYILIKIKNLLECVVFDLCIFLRFYAGFNVFCFIQRILVSFLNNESFLLAFDLSTGLNIKFEVSLASS